MSLSNISQALGVTSTGPHPARLTLRYPQMAMSLHKGTQAALTGLVALVILMHQTLQILDEISQASAGHDLTPRVKEAAKIG